MFVRIPFAAMLLGFAAALVTTGTEAITARRAEGVERTVAGLGCLAASTREARVWDGGEAVAYGLALAGLGLVLGHWGLLCLVREGSRWIRPIATSSALCLAVTVCAAFPPLDGTARTLAFWIGAIAPAGLLVPGRTGRILAASALGIAAVTAPVGAACAALAWIGAGMHAASISGWRPREDTAPEAA